MHGKVTDRVLRMFEAIRAYGPPRWHSAAVYFTESFKTTEGQPAVLLRLQLAFVIPLMPGTTKY